MAIGKVESVDCDGIGSLAGWVMGLLGMERLFGFYMFKWHS